MSFKNNYPNKGKVSFIRTVILTTYIIKQKKTIDLIRTDIFTVRQHPRRNFSKKEHRTMTRKYKYLTLIGILPYSYIYQKIWSQNYRAADCSNLDKPIMIAPEVGFPIINPVITLEESSIVIKADALGSNTGIKPEKNKFIQVAGIIIMKEPSSPRADNINFLPFTGEKQILNMESEINMVINFTGSTESLYRLYKTRKCHFIFVTSDENGNPCDYSETIVSI
jgi:hypothetical protein